MPERTAAAGAAETPLLPLVTIIDYKVRILRILIQPAYTDTDTRVPDERPRTVREVTPAVANDGGLAGSAWKLLRREAEADLHTMPGSVYNYCY